MVRVNWAPTRSMPRSMVFLMGPTTLPQPNGSSMSLRFWPHLVAPWRMVRASMAERFALAAMCGVTHIRLAILGDEPASS